MPEDSLAGIPFASCKQCDQQIVDPLGIKMNLVAVVLRKTFDNFGKGALCAVAPVYKGREDGDAQVKRSLQRELSQQPESLLGPRQQVLAGEKEFRERATEEN